MKSAIAFFFVLLVFLLCADAFADGLKLTKKTPERGIAKPDEIVTLAFEAVFTGDVEDTFGVAVEADASMSLISNIKQITLYPGTPITIAISFLVAGTVVDRQELRVVVTLTSLKNTSLTSSVSGIFIVTIGVCAEIETIPEQSAEAKYNAADVSFILRNCGDNQASFTLKIKDEPYFIVKTKQNEFTLKPGDFAKIHLIVEPVGDTPPSSSTVNIEVLRNRNVVVAKQLPFNLRLKSVVLNSRNYQYISLIMKLEHILGTGVDPRTSLRFTIPPVRDEDFSFKSDVWLSSYQSRVVTRRQNYEFGVQNTRILLGNQQYVFSKMMNGFTIHDGRLVERNRKSGVASIIAGTDGKRNINAVKWEHPLTPRLSIGAGHVTIKTNGDGASRIEDKKLSAVYKINTNTVLDAELNSLRSINGSDGYIGTGLGYQLGGKYQCRSFQLNVANRNSFGFFASNDYIKGTDIHFDYNIGSSSIYFDTKHHLSYAVSNSGSIIRDYKPLEYNNTVIGYNKPIRGRKITLSTSINKNSTQKLTSKPVYKTTVASDKALRVSLVKQYDALSIGVGSVTGSRSGMRNTQSYQRYEYVAKYDKNKTNISISLSNSIDFESSEYIAIRDRCFSLTAEHIFDKDKVFVQMGWKREMTNMYFPDTVPTTRFIIRLNGKITKNSNLELVYEHHREMNGTGSIFTAEYVRDLIFCIPYKKYGTVTGMVYEDTNRNGIYDDKELLLKNVRVIIDDEYAATTGPDGKYEIKEIPPGKHSLSVDSKSYPVGLANTNNYTKQILVKSGANRIVDIPLQKVMTISGRVIVDKSDYFSRYANISPNQLKIVLSKNGLKIAETFTDKDGLFYFENIEQGEYEVLLDPTWLQKSAVIIGDNKSLVECYDKKENRDVIFTISGKKKEIKISYEE